VLDLAEIPRRVLVVGGGAIGCEFASMFADLEADVTIVEGAPRILAGVDADISQVVAKSFRKKNIRVITDSVCVSHTPSESGATSVTLSSGEQIEVDAVVLAVGRKPCTEGLGLEETSVTVSPRGFVEVDEYCRTNVQSIFAVGDLIDTPQLAHVAYAEAILVIKQILNETAIPVDYDRVPWAIYCHPEVAWAGLSESQAKEVGLDVVVSKHQFRSNSRAMIVGETDGLVKVIALKRVDGKAGQILGVHMTGPWVTEQLGAGYLAVNWEASVEEVAHLVQPHPSLSELFGETVLALTGRSINS
jgi:dihydrolipoamide dehydrogenase